MDSEKIREFLYDLDRARGDNKTIHNLIIDYQNSGNTSGQKSMGTSCCTVNLLDIDEDDNSVSFEINLDGYEDTFWLDVDEDTIDSVRDKLGKCIFNGEI